MDIKFRMQKRWFCALLAFMVLELQFKWALARYKKVGLDNMLKSASQQNMLENKITVDCYTSWVKDKTMGDDQINIS